MLREILYQNTNLPIAKNAMNAYAARHRAIASNIANAETPNYSARAVTFEDELKQALGNPDEPMVATDRDHMPMKSDPRKVTHLVVEDQDQAIDQGVNNVDIDRAMSQLATNQIHYAAAVRAAKGHFTKIRLLAKLP